MQVSESADEDGIATGPWGCGQETEAARPFSDLSRADVAYAGGKGANLGEMTGAGVPIPPGFVVGAPAYASFCEAGGLRERMAARLDGLDVDDTEALAAAAADLRKMVEAEPIPAPVEEAIRAGYAELSEDSDDLPVAVRSSATAEDTEAASFAGMNETLLNVQGADAVVDAVRRCWSSLFGGRTVFYRAKRGFGQADMDIAVVVQRQVLSTRAGVMFTIDPASGATDRLVIEGSFGLGEAVVSGSVSPDRYVVEKDSLAILERDVKRKELVIEPQPGGGTVTRELSGEEAVRPVLSDDEVQELGELGRRIEGHYGRPQDTEWCFDSDGRAWMLQSRPVTSAGGAPMGAVGDGEVLVRGLGAAPGTASGAVRVIKALDGAEALNDGEVLVTHMTAPDWVPLMRRAAAIVTDSGGMTCHAAIVSRELGIPCVVGTAEATERLRDGEIVTIDATNGEIREGAAPIKVTAVAPAGHGGGLAGDRHQAPRQPLGALADREGGRSRRRRRRPAARRADGDRGSRRSPSEAADAAGPKRGVRLPNGGFADQVRERVFAPADHVSDDRLPHQRVPRTGGWGAVRARGVEPDDRIPRSASLHARARSARP